MLCKWCSVLASVDFEAKFGKLPYSEFTSGTNENTSNSNTSSTPQCPVPLKAQRQHKKTTAVGELRDPSSGNNTPLQSPRLFLIGGKLAGGVPTTPLTPVKREARDPREARELREGRLSAASAVSTIAYRDVGSGSPDTMFFGSNFDTQLQYLEAVPPSATSASVASTAGPGQSQAQAQSVASASMSSMSAMYGISGIAASAAAALAALGPPSAFLVDGDLASPGTPRTPLSPAVPALLAAGHPSGSKKQLDCKRKELVFQLFVQCNTWFPSRMSRFTFLSIYSITN